MNQQQLDKLNLIVGAVLVPTGIMMIYQTLANNIAWNGIFGGIGLILVGLSSLLQKKINSTAKIILSASALLFFVINMVMLFV
ncbi:hypothetical protein [Herpetosiphon giganteus]|uniref:hypothetical protein n=1 Tax=Herpetosiphon giganteus TaxID=2029754 RepID=UPI00195EE048|nr:hypothetical protein [Herpetosiphon giganteus]MBM7842071.1 membrane-bound ClpP family serine protease [Herpetosiphon giganteus]